MKRRHALGGIFVASTLAVAGLGVSLPGFARGDNRREDDRGPSGFGVEFSDCVESIGVGLAPIEQVRALVPREFQLVGEGGAVTPIVVRTARCGRIAVDGHRPKAGTIVQVGAVIVPPDSSGDINNFTLWYYTSDEELRPPPLERRSACSACADDRLRVRAGRGRWPEPVPRPRAQARPSDLAARGDRGGIRHPCGVVRGQLVGEGGREEREDEHEGARDFHRRRGSLAQHAQASPLGRLIGGDSMVFPVLQQFNQFAGAQMEVSIAEP